MIRFYFILILVCPLLWARAAVEAVVDCPVCPLEKCFWQISLSGTGSQIEVDWRKGIQSLHTEKPFAEALRCNADRDFNTEAGGYIQIWYRGENKPCLALAPGDCGVSFKMLPGGMSPLGFTVRPPSGKRLDRFEHLSTLNLQCGNLESADGNLARYRWDALLKWDRRSRTVSARTLRLEKN